MTITARFASTCNRCHQAIVPGQAIDWVRGRRAVFHADPNLCVHARATAAPAPVVDLTPIANFIKAAVDRGLRRPKLRVLSPDNREMVLSLTTKGSAPGSIAVKLEGEFIGCIRPDGAVVARLASRPDLHARLLAVAANPAQAAKEYAALMCRCCFCALPLTDAGSVEVGYGPICAQHWGLPHTPQGTPHLHQPAVMTSVPMPAGMTPADVERIVRETVPNAEVVVRCSCGEYNSPGQSCDCVDYDVVGPRVGR